MLDLELFVLALVPVSVGAGPEDAYGDEVELGVLEVLGISCGPALAPKSLVQ